MALIGFGKKEVEELENRNEILRSEIEKMNNQYVKLNVLVIEKDKELVSYQNQIKELARQVKDFEKL